MDLFDHQTRRRDEARWSVIAAEFGWISSGLGLIG